MTASASVVEELLLMKIKELIREQSEGEWADETIEKDAHVFAAALSSLFTPHPAEQDAREAVAWRWRKADQGFGPGYWEYGSEPIKGASPGYYEIEPLYEALTQAAPDGWVLVPVKWTEVARYATETGLTAYDRNTRMAEFRRIVTPEAVLSLSASPAPPAQGAGG